MVDYSLNGQQGDQRTTSSRFAPRRCAAAGSVLVEAHENGRSPKALPDHAADPGAATSRPAHPASGDKAGNPRPVKATGRVVRPGAPAERPRRPGARPRPERDVGFTRQSRSDGEGFKPVGIDAADEGQIDDQPHRKHGQLLGDGPVQPMRCIARRTHSPSQGLRPQEASARSWSTLHQHNRSHDAKRLVRPNDPTGATGNCGPGWVGVTETSWRLSEMSSRSSPDARLPAKVNRHAAHAQADCAVTGGVGVQDRARRCGIPGVGSDRVSDV